MSKKKVTKDKIDKNDNKVRIILITMIKNESKIILRNLESVIDFVDAICVCDTGSTDNTIEIVQNFFKKTKIPTKLAHHKWQDFGHNRSLSFDETVKFCKELNWDTEKTYGLILDGDNKLVHKPSFNRQELTENGYNLMMKTPHFIYYLPVILKLSRNWKSIGVTHEYWDDLSGDFDPSDIDHNDLYINDIGDGGSKGDKYERDIKLLSDELKIDTTNSRNWFYLGQSYFDIRRYDEAIETFEKRKTMGENPYEVYKSYYNILISKINSNKSDEVINKSFDECYKLYPFMLEPIYYLMEHYLEKEEYEKAFNIGKLGIDIEMDDIYMTEFQIYEYKYKDDMIYVCIKNKKYGIGVKLALELLKNNKLDKEDIDRIKENLNECLINLVQNDL